MPNAEMYQAAAFSTGKISGVGYMTRLLLFGEPGVDYTEEALFFTSSGPIEEYVEATPFAFAVTGVSIAIG